MIAISRAAGTKERTNDPVLHYMVRDYDPQLKIFEHITVVSVVLESPYEARSKIEVEVSDSLALAEAIQEASSMISLSKRPIIIAGVELRFGLQLALMRLAEKTGIPVISTILNKSCLDGLVPASIVAQLG